MNNYYNTTMNDSINYLNCRQDLNDFVDSFFVEEGRGREIIQLQIFKYDREV